MSKAFWLCKTKQLRYDTYRKECDCIRLRPQSDEVLTRDEDMTGKNKKIKVPFLVKERVDRQSCI